MDAKQFLAEFGHIANAPCAVQHLRELILQLAIEGKLVSQNDDDSSVQENLKKIYQAKLIIAERDKFKAFFSDLEVNSSDKDFPLPSGWMWCYLDNLAAIARGGSPRPIKSFLTNDQSGLNWIKISDSIRGNLYIESAGEKIMPSGLKSTREVYPGDLILSNSMSFGYPYILKITGCIHDGWLVIRLPNQLVNKLYIYYLLRSPYVRQKFTEAAAGAVVQNLNADKVKQLPVPLPPLEEQSRIVAKVEELMAICDKLEVQQQQKRKLQNKLRQSILQAVANAESPKELQDSWERLAGNFSHLFTTFDDIAEVRELVVQLAIQGKLVAQIKNDFSAWDELKEIYKEKSVISERDGFKQFFSKLECDLKDQDFLIPKNWLWCYLDNLAAIARGGSPRPIKSFLTSDSDGLNWIKISDSVRGAIYIDSAKEKILPVGLSNTREVYPGDMILSNSMSFGYPYILRISGCIHDGWLVIRLPDYLVNKLYVYYLLRSSYARQKFTEAAAGAVVQNLNADKVKQLLVPLPPLEEQFRIVSKIHELMGFCDTLEAKLRSVQKTAERLATAAIASLTGISTLQQEEPMKVPKTELKAPVRLGTVQPSSNTQAPLASLLARHNGEMGANDLWQRFGGEIDAFYAQLKTEVRHGWIAEPTGAQMLEKEAD